MDAPPRQPRRRPNGIRDAAIYADSITGGGELDSPRLAEKYGLTTAQIATVIYRQKKQHAKQNQGDQNARE